MHSTNKQTLDPTQGKPGEEPYGTASDLFGAQSETIEATVMELNITRSHVLDYFHELQIPEKNEIFSWEKGAYKMAPEVSGVAMEVNNESRFLKRLGVDVADDFSYGYCIFPPLILTIFVFSLLPCNLQI